MTSAKTTPKTAVETFFHKPTATACYLAYDPETLAGVIIDPALDFDASTGTLSTESVEAILARADDLGVVLHWVLETHAHADHLSAAAWIREQRGAKVAIGANITAVQAAFGPLFNAIDVAPNGSAFDLLLGDGAVLTLGGLTIDVIATPGHTPACVSYKIGDAVFVGDTLFMPDYGTARCDFPGGDAATLYQSIQRLFELPDETRVFVGHDYLPAGRTQNAWETTIGAEKSANIHIKAGVDQATFVAMRTARDATLTAPALILPSLQVNIRAGALPPVASDGHVYLSLPINRLGAKAA